VVLLGEFLERKAKTRRVEQCVKNNEFLWLVALATT